MEELQSIQIIKAEPGYKTIYRFEDIGVPDAFELGEDVLAWKFEVHFSQKKDDIYVLCVPLCIEGDVATNCIGVKNPDGTVSLFGETLLKSFEEIEEYYKKYYPKK